MASKIERLEAIAKCCRVSASMLRMADSGEPDANKRKKYEDANEGQAKLLDKASEMALELVEEMKAPA